MPKKILLVEDEKNVADFVIQGLEEDGYTVSHVSRYSELLFLLQGNSYDLLVLDVLLPEVNGLEICKNLRTMGYTDLPILMLTALGSPENVVLGLDSGADDYLSKPFKLIELKARIRTLIRRREEITKYTQNNNDGKRYGYKFLEIDDFKKVAFCDGQELNLTSTEYKLLLLFVQMPKKVFSRNELLDKIWGINFDIGSNVVDVYVNYLRRKIERITTTKIIHTVIGMGYVLKIDD
ncbi:response regulator transcription factor [Sphingobacterium psychroaquaticum]|uniref:DNA-binding response regulator, OmpR family, contains REC and winged-helix (WHTH) domain n=1 Tax=Sphingobacterium psychroaquaticum TaxID=561061 RepID=A0A1X7IGD8_9SPHI|nr:response regulator transcription factor [Sphingobacterium psychroaquaticum]QBQ41593.1 response regulator transcription factor [Sphingobacterium psychroaquaticum]SMG13468.1 DNA-binding response regulator, OmpR family, contains REC and winged-helix (wHTH) domain [Sphingobacterium psychroaquaticum]